MRISMPAEDIFLDAAVCPSFGRTPYFLIYDLEWEKSTFLSNSATASQGAAGIKAAQAIADYKVNALLTPRCGENAAKVIKAAGIEIYRIKYNSLQDNLAAFREGQLPLLSEIHAGFHHHGGD